MVGPVHGNRWNHSGCSTAEGCRSIDVRRWARDGGCDSRVGGYAVEVKRAERFLSAWIEQAERQTGDDVPVVAWRRNGGRWRCLVVLLDVDGFVDQVRERVGAAKVPPIKTRLTIEYTHGHEKPFRRQHERTRR